MAIEQPETLEPDDYRRILAVLEAVGRAGDTTDFRRLTLEALDEHLGYKRGTFFLAGPPGPGFRPTDGATHGLREVDMQEYVEVWMPDDPFVSPAATAAMRRSGVVGLQELASDMHPEQRRYIGDFLLRQAKSQLSLWFETGTPCHGYLSVFGLEADVFGSRDRARLLALRPHLANLLRAVILDGEPPPGVDGLSKREFEIARLVAGGWSNREIAQHLAVTEDTVKKHLMRVMGKLRLRNRTQVALHMRRGRAIGYRRTALD